MSMLEDLAERPMLTVVQDAGSVRRSRSDRAHAAVGDLAHRYSWHVAALLATVTRGVVIDRSGRGWTIGPIFVGNLRHVERETEATFQLGMEVGHQLGASGVTLSAVGGKPRLRAVPGGA